ncbi:hypothetical protein HAX54_028269, partial [Datura stramonium]|nr:hypothetical protein [Datura stramonium]
KSLVVSQNFELANGLRAGLGATIFRGPLQQGNFYSSETVITGLCRIISKVRSSGTRGDVPKRKVIPLPK